MKTTTAHTDLDRLAERRVNARMGWYTHATIYAIVMSGLTLLGWWQGRFWPVAPALGWGLGLAMHALSVFVWGSGSPLRAGMVRRERERLQQRQVGDL